MFIASRFGWNVIGFTALVGLLGSSIAITGEAPRGAAAETPSDIVRRAGEMGSRFKVDLKSERPVLIALRIRHDMCPICKSIESRFDPIVTIVNDNAILLVTIDLSNEATLRQSSMLIASLGLEGLWPTDFTGVGSVTMVAGASKEALATIQTDDVDEIRAFIRRHLDEKSR